MKKRVIGPQNIGESQQRTRVILESEPCAQVGVHGMHIRQQMLIAIADQPDLTACGYHAFQTLKMHHNGTAWIVEVEATVENGQFGATLVSPRQPAGPTSPAPGAARQA